MIKETLSADIAKIIRDVVLNDMQRFGAVEVDTVPAPDHDGDPSLRIDVRYDGDGDAIDPKAMSELLFKLHDRLWRHGETRFPYIRHHVPETQKVIGFR